MKLNKIKLVRANTMITFITSIVFIGFSGMGGMKMKPPKGSAQDVTNSNNVWSELMSVNLVGNNAKKSRPYKRQHLHYLNH